MNIDAINEAAEKLWNKWAMNHEGFVYMTKSLFTLAMQSPVMKQYWFEKFKPEQKQSEYELVKALQKIAQCSDCGSAENTVIEIKRIASDALKNSKPTNEDELVAANKETEIWEEILAHVNKVIDSPSYDYGVPFYVVHDLLDNIRKEYLITKK